MRKICEMKIAHQPGRMSNYLKGKFYALLITPNIRATMAMTSNM